MVYVPQAQRVTTISPHPCAWGCWGFGVKTTSHRGGFVFVAVLRWPCSWAYIFLLTGDIINFELTSEGKQVISSLFDPELIDSFIEANRDKY
jgi:hypothetical protein